MSPQQLMERLLFDEELRERFFADRAAVIEEAGVPPALFLSVDAEGLRIDAEGRRRYLMSALCRPYPLSAAAIGAALGPHPLSAFLASPALFGPLGQRSAAFGDHLARLLELSVRAPAPALELLRATLALERGLVDNAAALRAAADQAPGAPARPSSGQLKRGRIVLPPYFLAVELPAPPEILRAALDGVGPEDCWSRVQSSPDFDRVVAVARGDAGPVTVLARGIVRGMSLERAGSGGVSPLVDLSHLSATLAGRQTGLVQSLLGHRLGELPAARARVARALVEAGVLALGA